MTMTWQRRRATVLPTIRAILTDSSIVPVQSHLNDQSRHHHQQLQNRWQLSVEINNNSISTSAGVINLGSNGISVRCGLATAAPLKQVAPAAITGNAASGGSE